jgi:hypothetical protein
MPDESTPPRDADVERFWGMPMRWQAQNMFKNLWNPEEKRVFPPKYFGIGWDLNLRALAVHLGLIGKSSEGK